MNLDLFNYNCEELTGSNRLAELERENCQFQCKIEIISNYNCNSLVNIMPFTFSFKRKKTQDTKNPWLKHILHTAQTFSAQLHQLNSLRWGKQNHFRSQLSKLPLGFSQQNSPRFWAEWPELLSTASSGQAEISSFFPWILSAAVPVRKQLPWQKSLASNILLWYFTSTYFNSSALTGKAKVQITSYSSTYLDTQLGPRRISCSFLSLLQ